jgi:hypothetical protein
VYESLKGFMVANGIKPMIKCARRLWMGSLLFRSAGVLPLTITIIHHYDPISDAAEPLLIVMWCFNTLACFFLMGGFYQMSEHITSVLDQHLKALKQAKVGHVNELEVVVTRLKIITRLTRNSTVLAIPLYFLCATW